MKNYKKNLKILEEGHVYSKEMEHDACGVATKPEPPARFLAAFPLEDTGRLLLVPTKKTIKTENSTG